MIIEIKDLIFASPGSAAVLKNISLSIKKGEKVGVIGSNGSGKSTLVYHLNGLNKPTSGSVAIDGLKIEKSTAETVRRKVGLLFQNPDDMLFMPRIIDDLLFGPLNVGMNRDEALVKAAEFLKMFDIAEFADRPPFTLSQGQRRFAALAAVLMMDPEILVMDEPTSDLDPFHRRKLINLLQKRNETMVTVSHDLDFISDTCERVILLLNGKIQADGKASDILSNRELLENNQMELPLRLQ
ncbi:MAG: ABC transporter ATP-binding protein [Fibrobacteres bacterium]|nr:ABC transporter ATP-binding protein [Fibrobacterota bacterium]